MQSKDIIEVLENPEAKEFIVRHLNDDIATLSLKYSGKVNFNITVCLQLIKLYSKSQKKLPLFSNNLLALTQRSYEQCTSAKIAKHKSTFIQGQKLIDLTAGIGVDSLFLSSNFTKVEAVECDAELHQLALYNIQQLGNTKITRVLGKAEETSIVGFDWVYLDPDRRDESRHIKLEMLKPDVNDLLDKFRATCAKVYIKLSPLFDVEEAIRVFTNLSKLHLLAERGEIKEVGVELDFSKEALKPKICLKDVSRPFEFSFPIKGSTKTASVDYFQAGSILILPNSLLIKSKSTSLYLKGLEVKKHRDFEIYQSESEIEIKGIRSFEILQVSTLATKRIKQMIKSNAVEQINLIIKGLPTEILAWHKKLSTRDGGDYFLFLLKGKERQALLAKLIS